MPAIGVTSTLFVGVVINEPIAAPILAPAIGWPVVAAATQRLPGKARDKTGQNKPDRTTLRATPTQPPLPAPVAGVLLLCFAGSGFASLRCQLA